MPLAGLQLLCRRLVEELKIIFCGEEQSKALTFLYGFDPFWVTQSLLPEFDVVIETTLLPDVCILFSGSHEPVESGNK